MYKAPVVVAENLQATSILMSTSLTPTPGGIPTGSQTDYTGGDAPTRGL